MVSLFVILLENIINKRVRDEELKKILFYYLYV